MLALFGVFFASIIAIWLYSMLDLSFPELSDDDRMMRVLFYSMFYWISAICLILVFVVTALNINSSRKTLIEYADNTPYRAYIDITSKGRVLLTNKKFADALLAQNPEADVKIRSKKHRPRVLPDVGKVLYLVVLAMVFLVIAWFLDYMNARFGR